MSRISRLDNQIVVKRDPMQIGIGISALFMAGTGVKLLLDMRPFGHTLGDVLGGAFICVWITLVLTLGLSAAIQGSKQITIRMDGVQCKSLVKTEFLEWYEIKDWGLSYCGQTKGEGNTYYLYFSKQVFPVKNVCKKKLKGKMIKTHVYEDGYNDTVTEIVPFCKKRTRVEPFIGKDKYHIL